METLAVEGFEAGFAALHHARLSTGKPSDLKRLETRGENPGGTFWHFPGGPWKLVKKENYK
jgi:hypothetical protein